MHARNKKLKKNTSFVRSSRVKYISVRGSLCREAGNPSVISAPDKRGNRTSRTGPKIMRKRPLEYRILAKI